MIEWLMWIINALSYSIQALIYCALILCLSVLICALGVQLLKVMFERLIALYFYCKMQIRLGRCKMEKKLSDEKVKM